MEKRFLTPAETIRAIVENGRRVLTQSRLRTVVLSFLSGVYIAFGAELATVVTQDAAGFVGQGIARLLSGSVFSLGLMLVVVCGAELFTGNTLLSGSALQGEISWGKVLENWLIVILGNLVGSLFIAWLMFESRLWSSGNMVDHSLRIAVVKCQLPFGVALVRGILCNWLVCLAVFMATAARDVAGKFLACYGPIMAFVASGFEHSVANMYFIPTGLLLSGELGRNEPGLTWGNFFMANLLPVTIGNILGGVVFVASAYWYVHLKGEGRRERPEG
ncbi:formate/nitrite transporter family protein [Geobacter hydrogenophilus]|uniref:Bidirectional formate transporter n=1 Tax=Geobacter hydrogenophilus TaxID=40983 RepID=A0A9W6G1J1_9BACT|nr:formate/nitrite transporter family protein [Geobacter hydrogenophilus]MBT0892804.1 formate/nitrite transporter family protein [Geobacter hydrogenophilus]GLI38722.1 bidirectional formate transporter [Geobacter hydrogenophilus]